jgi:AcrR family transcriptional regulator
VTMRSEAKADRRRSLLLAASRLFAERGFNGISLEELGTAIEVSGPAVYRYFPSKQAVLAALLLEVSENLLEGGTAVVARGLDPAETLAALVRFQVAFALDQPDVIRVQDRDLESLGDGDRRRVRMLQARYVDLWAQAVAALRPQVRHDELQILVHAAFGLINSTPHSVRSKGAPVDRETAQRVLEGMALAALGSAAPAGSQHVVSVPHRAQRGPLA